MIHCFISGIPGTQYPESVRKFCLRQQYYSMAAYQSLRLFFSKHIPSKRTLQLWYSSIDGSPGICDSALKIISEKAESYLSENKHQLHLCLMSDDMAISKILGWNIESEKFDGFVTATNSSRIGAEENLSRKVAKEAFVIMAVGPDFKIPIAYEFINGLEALDRARITLEVIKRIEATGAIVISLTGDGHNVNIATVNTLGANCNGHQPYFYSPSHPEQKIYFILDPAHMIKLIRKHFSSENLYYKGQLLDWNLLRLLQDRQSTENFSLCKLTRKHIDWRQKPMNVMLAVQTLSRGNAILLKQLKEDGYKEFEHCDATAELLLNFNHAFDIQNFGERNQANNEYKQPICESSVETIFKFGKQFMEYVKRLEIERVTVKITKRIPILDSREHVGFLGFYNNFISLEGIYEDFVKNGPLKKFYPFQFSQDHLETLFSLIRNCQGRNDNPSTIEFRSAFRKLLICHPIITSVGHNIITNATGILNVSSRKPTKMQPIVGLEPTQRQEFELELEVDYDSLLKDELDEMDPYDHHTVAYVALCVEEKLIQKMENAKNKHQCSQCINLLLTSNEKIHDELLSMKATNSQPSRSTVNIIIFATAIMKLISVQQSQGNDYNIVWRTIFNHLNIDDLYRNENFNQHQHKLIQSLGHKEDFVVHLIKIFMTLKSQKIGNKITEEERGELIRNRRKQDVHHAGQ